MSETVGKYLGWIGIVIGVVGFFWMPITLGIIAIALGIIGLFSQERTINIITIIVGVLALIIGII